MVSQLIPSVLSSTGFWRAANPVQGIEGPAGLKVMPIGSVTLGDALDPGERTPTRPFCARRYVMDHQ